MARSVEDAALLYVAMQGPDPLDPRTAAACPSPIRCRNSSAACAACGWPACRTSSAQHASAEVLAAYDASLDELERLGAEIVADRPALPLRRRGGDATCRIMAAESYAILHELIDDDERAARPGSASAHRRAAATITAHAYLEALPSARR